MVAITAVHGERQEKSRKAMLLSRDVSIPFLGTNIAPRNVVGKMMLRSFRGDKICMQAATENLP